jgi:hypothetical protein
MAMVLGVGFIGSEKYDGLKHISADSLTMLLVFLIGL